MACDIIEKVNDVLAQYNALCLRCCSYPEPCTALLPGNTADLCGDGRGLLNEVYDAVTSMLAGVSGCIARTFADPYYPAPETPEIQRCMTEEWLVAFAAWIEHITCTTICGLAYSSPVDQGYDEIWGIPAHFTVSGGILWTDIVFYDVNPDQMILYDQNGSILYDSGCILGTHSTPVIIPAGTTYIRVQVIANCDGNTGSLWVMNFYCDTHP